MVLLVTAEELASHRQDENVDRASAEQAIRTASAYVESLTGIAFTARTATVSLPAPAGLELSVPLRPLRTASPVLIGETAYTDFTQVGGYLWRASGWRTGTGPSSVTVTATYGTDAAPDDIKGVVLEVADEIYEQILAVSSDSIDDQRTAYTGQLSHISRTTLANYGVGAGTVNIVRSA